jgi:DNA-binding response OmpR family regulator
MRSKTRAACEPESNAPSPEPRDVALVEPGTLVVIVDDDRELASSVSDFLTLEGYEVRPFATAETALAQIVSGLAPSLVILDLWIPTMGAAEFLRRLRRFTPSTPVLLLSGAVPDLERAGLDANAVLAKPAESTSLVRVVDKLITSHKARRPPVRAAARRP